LPAALRGFTERTGICSVIVAFLVSRPPGVLPGLGGSIRARLP
jgi:hypothetical protein